MVFIDDNNLINKSWDENYLLSKNGTKFFNIHVCCITYQYKVI